MESRKGFTLIELMVVILIVGILAAVAIPIMRGRVDAAKWSEGKAIMGTIATAIRAYCAEVDKAPAGTQPWDELGFKTGDLKGAYFQESDFEVTACDYDANDLTMPLTFTIKGEKTELDPDNWYLVQDDAGCRFQKTP